MPNFENDEKFYDMLRSLNEEQQVGVDEFVSRVKEAFKNSPRVQFSELFFLSGAAGTGKGRKFIDFSKY